MTTPPHERYEFGAFQLDAARRLLRRGDAVVPLKPKAFDLLTLLLANSDRVLGKEELLTSLWPRQFVEEASLTQTIYELRRSSATRRDGDVPAVSPALQRFTERTRSWDAAIHRH